MKPVLRQTPELIAQINTQRVQEGWDNVLCAGGEYTLSEQVEQIEQRLWETGLAGEVEVDE